MKLVPGRDAVRLFYEYVFPLDGGSVRVQCLNTAWVSQTKETAGQLAYPEALVSDAPGDDALVVALMHHPVNWLLPTTAREVRRRLQRNAQVVLTGHEHEYAARSQRDESGGVLLHLEGAALHAHGPEEASAFNAVVVDTAAGRFRVVSFAWNGSRYADEPGAFTDWTPFAADRLRGTCAYPVSGAMIRQLSEPGVDLHHPTKGPLQLDDIFVYPDLREVDAEPAQRQPRIVSARVLLERSAAVERVLVTGTRESGRTSLAKRLFNDAVEAGLVPVLVDGRKARLRGEVLRDQKELARTFEEQYDAPGDVYLGLPRERRVILVDNYHALDAATAEAVVTSLSHAAGRVILFAHDLTQHVQDLVSLAGRQRGAPAVEHLHIMPYGHVRREELIDRYVQLAAGDDRERGEKLRVEMRTLLNTALGKYYAPPVPVVIVSLLQARAFNDDLNLSQSTYGYYYELLIKRSLATGARPGEFDVSVGYLTALAAALFADGQRKTWDEAWFMDFHRRFAQQRMLRLNFTAAQSTLIERGVLVMVGDAYEFRHGYYHYYFTARALAERLTSDAGRADVRALSERLDEEEAANTLLFLTHLSKDAAVIDPILEQAARVFAETERALLTKSSVVMPGMDATLRRAVYVEQPIQDARHRYLGALDAADPEMIAARAESAATAADAQDRAERSEDVAEMTSLMSRIYGAFRTMQILGQLLKNFPGTLDGDQKRRLTRSVYDVGLRVLGAVHDLLRTRMDQAAETVVWTLREGHPDLAEPELLERARSLVYYYVYASAFGTIQRIATNVGHPLLEPVYDEIEAADSSPAVRLISTALRLDRAGGFPLDRIDELRTEFAKNPLALRLLRSLVITHFHLFEVDRKDKDRVCAWLDIDYKALSPATQRRTRLLAPPAAARSGA